MIILKRILRKQVDVGDGISFAHVRNMWRFSSYMIFTIHVQKAGNFWTSRHPVAEEEEYCLEFVC
jgi:hypothetical protein